MEQTNHWYGHSQILARYCGLEDPVPPQIWGALQHGWNIEHGLGPNHFPHDGFPRFVWSEIAARRAQSRGWRDAVVIGAPWLYLLVNNGLDPAAPEAGSTDRHGTIFYPFHSWDRGTVSGDHTQLIADIRETEGDDVTICLYWLEYDDPAIRRVYEDAGFRVICHGRRGRTRHDADPAFLERQLAELLRHRRVTSNRVTTAILYGLSVGCEAGVYGEPMQYWESSADAPEEDALHRTQRMYGLLNQARIDPAAGRALAARELGIGHLAAPAELREMLGWAA